MSDKTVIYCMGAAKAGTSWLFDYLYSHPECYFTPVKELHYWDALEFGRGTFYRDHIPGRIDGIRGRYKVTDDTGVRAYQEANMAANQRWYDLFDGKTRDDDMYREFLGLNGAKGKVVGDFTPAYGTLSTRWIGEMAALAPDTRFMMLLREPVDRLWSHLRMDAAGDDRAALAKLDVFLDGGEKNVAMRSNYRRTINRVMEVVERTAFHIEFYERLFTVGAIERLCGFLGISAHPAEFGKNVHKSEAQGGLDEARRAKAEAALKPQYNFIERFLGELPQEWTARMVTA